MLVLGKFYVRTKWMILEKIFQAQINKTYSRIYYIREFLALPLDLQ